MRIAALIFQFAFCLIATKVTVGDRLTNNKCKETLPDPHLDRGNQDKTEALQTTTCVDEHSIHDKNPASFSEDGHRKAITVFRESPSLKLSRRRRFEIGWPPWKPKTTPIPKPGPPDSSLLVKQLKQVHEQMDKCSRDLIFTTTRIKLKSGEKDKGIKYPTVFRRRRSFNLLHGTASPLLQRTLPPLPERPPKGIHAPYYATGAFKDRDDILKQQVVLNRDKLAKCQQHLMDEKSKLIQIDKAQEMVRINEAERTAKDERRKVQQTKQDERGEEDLDENEAPPDDDVVETKDETQKLRGKAALFQENADEQVNDIKTKMKKLKEIQRLQEEIKRTG